MKKIATITIVFLMVFSMFSIFTLAVKAEGDAVLFLDDFEAYSVGSFPSTGGWSLVYNGMGTQYQLVTNTISRSPTQSLQLWGQSGWSANAERRFTSTSEILGFEVYVRTDGNVGSGWKVASVCFWNLAGAAWGKRFADVAFGNDGELYTRPVYGSSTYFSLGVSYEAHRWYKIKVIVDRAAGQYNVWVDDILRAKDVAIWDTFEINAMMLESGHTATKAYFDDVKVFAPLELPSPWDDNDDDNRENFLDLEGLGESLLDYGVSEDHFVSVGGFAQVWKFNIGYKSTVILPEGSDEVEAFTRWVKEHVSTQDYDFVTEDLLDYYIPLTYIIEFDKDVLTSLPYIGFYFELLPSDSQNNIVRWCFSVGWDEIGTFAELLWNWGKDPAAEAAILSRAVYSSPCITDGDGQTSHLTEKDLWFRLTRPRELSAENVAKYNIKAALSILPLFGQYLQGAIPSLEDLAVDLGADVLIDFILDYVFDLLKIGDILLEEPNLVLFRLLDLVGDVDMGLYIDGNLVLGSNETGTLPSSVFGDYLGDFATELMIVNASQLTSHNAKILIISSEVSQPENITFSWLSFYGNELVNSGEQNHTIAEGQFLEYGITLTDGIPQIIPWEHIFEDAKRGTMLKISTNDQYFQFMAPDKTFSVKYDPDMFVFRHLIIICFGDEELRILTLAIDTRWDICLAWAQDVQTGKSYWLIDKRG